LISVVGVCVAVGLSIFLSRFFIKEESIEKGVYKYALAFGNSGYVGDPLVNTMHGDLMLSYYKMYTMPVSIAIYTWGLSVMTPKGKGKGALKSVLNPPTISLFVGILFGLTGIMNFLPEMISETLYSTLDTLKGCVGPTAMLLAGITIASYDIKEMLSDKKVYIATVLRLVILPTVIISILFGFKELINLIFSLNIGNTVLFLCFFAVAAPLGLNTVVFPEAYGGSPKTGASMAMISHTLCVITIPLLYAVMVLLFGAPVIV
jgi:predicted permease